MTLLLWCLFGLAAIVPLKIALTIFATQPVDEEDLKAVKERLCEVKLYEPFLAVACLALGPMAFGAAVVLFTFAVIVTVAITGMLNRTLFRICAKKEINQ